MRTITLALAFASTTLAFGSALLAMPAAAQERVPFTGPHLDAVIGFDRMQGGGDHDDGVVFGGGGGWDFAVSSAVRAGVELEATGSSQKDCVGGVVVAGDRLCARARRDLYAGGRLGALVGPSTMAYVKAGYTNASVRTDYDTASGTGSVRDSDYLDGVRLGVGLEQMLGSNLSVKAEYRYSNYEQDVERHQIVAGLAYRF